MGTPGDLYWPAFSANALRTGSVSLSRLIRCMRLQRHLCCCCCWDAQVGPVLGAQCLHFSFWSFGGFISECYAFERQKYCGSCQNAASLLRCL